MDSSAHDLDDLVSRVLQPQKTGIDYVCPLCKNRHRSNLAGIEPVCTGPNPQWDEHPHTIMQRVDK